MRNSLEPDGKIKDFLYTVFGKGEERMMSEEFCLIMDKLNQIGVEVSCIKEDVSVLKEDVSALKEDVSGLKEDVSGLKEEVSGLKKEFYEFRDETRSELHVLHVLIENDLRRDIQIVAEGHAFLLERLKEVTKSQNHYEDLTLEVSSLRSDMMRVKAKLGMA